MNNWKDIESAPKDGTHLLLKTRDGRIYAGSYEEHSFLGASWFALIPCSSGWAFGSDSQIRDDLDRPLFWKELE